MDLFRRMQGWMNATSVADFLGPLALRLYLVPVFWVAGTNKMGSIENVASWFGNPDWGLGLPAPTLMAYLATYTEVLGAIALLVGLATRWFAIPLMITMLVAAFKVHAVNGWQAVADAQSPFPNANIEGAMERLEMARTLLQRHGNYDWLTETGNLVISNSGMEWAITYFVMLLALFFSGAGKLSIDHVVSRQMSK